MGALRLLLAWLVIISHSSPILGWQGLGGYAVTAFFIISGYYMALVLDGKYRAAGGLWLFYTNRALRLFPLYFLFLLLYLTLSWIGQRGWPLVDRTFYIAEQAVLYATDGSAGSLSAAVPNLFFLGSDALRLFLFDFETGGFVLWRNGMLETSEVRAASRYLVMPHIWSLGVEVVFYALAPLLAVARFSRLAITFAALVFLQLLLNSWLEDLAWVHLFSVWNLSYFVLGMLVHRLTPLLLGHNRRLLAAVAATPFLIATLVQGTFWPAWIVFALGLPALFALTKQMAFDKALGSLSYPVYLCHFLFAWPAAAVFGQLGSIVALLLSCALSWAALRLVDAPIERWRQRRVAKARASGPASVQGPRDVDVIEPPSNKPI